MERRAGIFGDKARAMGCPKALSMVVFEELRNSKQVCKRCLLKDDADGLGCAAKKRAKAAT